MDTFNKFLSQLQIKTENTAYVNGRGKNEITSQATIKTARFHYKDQVALEGSPADGISIQILAEVPNSRPSYLPLTEFSVKYTHKNPKRRVDVRQAYIAVKDGQKYQIQATNESKNDMIDIKVYIDGLFAGHLPVPQGKTRAFTYTRLKEDEVHKFSFTKIDYSESDGNARLNKWFGEPGTISLKVFDAERINLTEYERRKQELKELKHGFTKGNLIATKQMKFGETKGDLNTGREEYMIPTHLSTLDISFPLPIQDKEYYVWRSNPILYANYIYRSKETLQRHDIVPFSITDEDLVQPLFLTFPTTTDKKDVKARPLEKKSEKTEKKKSRAHKVESRKSDAKSLKKKSKKRRKTRKPNPNIKLESSGEDLKIDTKIDSGYDEAMYEDSYMLYSPSLNDIDFLEDRLKRTRRRKQKAQAWGNRSTDPNAESWEKNYEKTRTQKSRNGNIKPALGGWKGYKGSKKIDAAAMNDIVFEDNYNDFL